MKCYCFSAISTVVAKGEHVLVWDSSSWSNVYIWSSKQSVQFQQIWRIRLVSMVRYSLHIVNLEIWNSSLFQFLKKNSSKNSKYNESTCHGPLFMCVAIIKIFSNTRTYCIKQGWPNFLDRESQMDIIYDFRPHFSK